MMDRAAPESSPIVSSACRVHRFGGPEAITIEDVEVPSPTAGQARLRVSAAGVGPWDAWIRAGKSALPQPLPLTLGADLAGVIEARRQAHLDGLVAPSCPCQPARGRSGVFLVDVTTTRLIAALLATGEHSADFGAVLPLADARTAHGKLDGTRPKPRRKIVLSP